MTRSIRDLRNLGIIAHVDAGKTTLTERILFFTGRIHRAGEVHSGNTVTDFDDEERKHGITIRASTVSCAWRGHTLQIIDTPGHVDFGIEVERSLRVLDGAVLVLDAVAGVEPQTESVFRRARRFGVPCIAFVNKLDRAGASFTRSVDALRERLSIRAVPIVVPLETDTDIVLADVVRMHALVWSDPKGQHFTERALTAEETALVDPHRRALLEACADVDTDVLAAFVERGDVGPDLLFRALRTGTGAGTFVPVLSGSAYKNRGVQPLLDAIVSLLPSPAERPAVRGLEGTTRLPTSDAPFSALVFKTLTASHGALALVRVYSGAIVRGTEVRSMRTGKLVRVGRLVRVFAGSLEEIERAEAGDVVGIFGLGARTGDSLAAPDAPIVLESVDVPEPVASISLEPRTNEDRARLGPALARMTEEDPSLRVTTDPETGQALLSGLGELHLQVALARLSNDHAIEVRAGRPRVAYRETISGEATVEHEHSKQSGGPGQYALVVLRVSPGALDSGITFVDEVRQGTIPKEYVPGVEKGVRRAALRGVLGGHPVVDVAVTLLDGAFHSNDSSELAFAIAGERAFHEALRRAGPVLLEPVVELVVRAPVAVASGVLGDLMSRRARVETIEEELGERVVTTTAPLSELFGYADVLRSRTEGRGTFTMEPRGYAAAPTSDRGRTAA